MTDCRFAYRVAAIFTLVCIAASCGSDELDASPAPIEDSSDGEAERSSDGAVRDDVACDLESLPADESTEFLTVHYVVDGELGAVCYGEEDETVLAAWQQLGVITPPDQLHDLSLFAGFGFDATSDTETVAFVNVVDDEASGFQMSINLDAYDADPDEALLTIAHEFSHVFNNTTTQLDRSVEDPEDCDTYFNTEGCFRPDSVMAQWIELFWGDGLIDEIDVYADPDPADGENRCSIDARFLGSYAASNPEEDFGETFSAFVFDVTPVSAEVQAKFDWIANQPGLAEFRQRAEAAGLGPLDNNFEPCG